MVSHPWQAMPEKAILGHDETLHTITCIYMQQYTAPRNHCIDTDELVVGSSVLMCYTVPYQLLSLVPDRYGTNWQCYAIRHNP